MKNKMTDLNNHLFAELERLSDEDLQGDKLDEEIRRAEAVCSISTQIISNGALAIKAEQLRSNSLTMGQGLPDFLNGGENSR
jgi:hypothetical protein